VGCKEELKKCLENKIFCFTLTMWDVNLSDIEILTKYKSQYLDVQKKENKNVQKIELRIRNI